jgi:TetR/AcrR family transcriptional repressor of lmrAB and yxaGH operons
MLPEPRPADAGTPKARLILATLDLLRRSGLAGAGINQVVEASRSPRGSVYHYFPRGKHELVAAALRDAERTEGDGLRRLFGQSIPLGQKVRALFAAVGANLESNAYRKGCALAAVTLDLTEDSEELRGVCQSVFDTWLKAIAAGLAGAVEAERRAVAQLILVTLEGALILARASGTQRPLLDSGAWLADLLALKYPPARRGRTSRR